MRQLFPCALLLALLAGCAANGPASGARGEAAAAVPSTPPKVSPERALLARAAFEEGLAAAVGGDHAKAAGRFEASFAADPSLLWAGYDAGVFRLYAGEAEQAAAAFAKVLEVKPDFSPAAAALARLRVRTGQGAAAESEARARAERFPKDHALRNQLVEVLLAMGKLDEAEAEARRILKEDERQIAAMVNLAASYHRRGRNELALMVLENARQVAPKDPAVWNRLGFVQLALGDRTAALLAWKTAADLGPSYPEAQVNYGAMLVEAEDFRGAALRLEAAVRLAPGLPEAWLDLGNAYRGARRFDDAEAAYRRALALDPRLADAELDLALLHLDGEKPGLDTATRLERAIAHLERFETAGGDDPRLPQLRKEALLALDKEHKRGQRDVKDRLREGAK